MLYKYKYICVRSILPQIYATWGSANSYFSAVFVRLGWIIGVHLLTQSFYTVKCMNSYFYFEKWTFKVMSGVYYLAKRDKKEAT